MGDRAEDILTSMSLSQEDAADYDIVIQRFDQHFIKKRNVIYERARFNQRRQDEGETVDTFITALYKIAEHCQYGQLHDDMIRDRIVVGLKDATLAEKLQLDSDLTLEKAITRARKSESVNNKKTRDTQSIPGSHGRRVIDTCEEADKEAGALDAAMETA